MDVGSVTTETITFVGTDSNGCTTTESFEVTFQPRVVAETTNELIEICIGDSFPLEVTPGFNYEWDDPNGSLSSTITSNPIATPTETTAYSVAVTGACSDDVVVIQIQVVVNDLPEANAGEDRFVLPDRDFTLEASGGLSYSWDNTEFIVDGANTSTPTITCLLYTSPSPRDQRGSRMPSSA